jgi:tetratricopeptide (TPR) repeat protein
MRVLATLLIVLAAANAVDAKPRGKAAVKAHMDRAAKAHKAGDYTLALDELQAAYAIDPQPKLLYAIAQVHAKLDDCAKAIEYYEQFIAATPDKNKQAVAQQAIDACKQRLAAEPPPEPAAVEPAPEPEPEPPPAPPPVDEPHEPPAAGPPAREIRAFDEPRPAPPVAVTATTHSPWYSDPLGDALVIGGVGATVASIFMYRSAGSELDAAESATTLDAYADHRSGAERKQLYTVALAGGGIALVTAGVIRYALRDSRREAPAVAIVPGAGGGLITWSGGF